MIAFASDAVNEFILNQAAISACGSVDGWRRARTSYVTGTDMAAILGKSPYAKPVDIILKKRGLAPEVEQNEAMLWGTLLEDVVAEEYSKRTSTPIRKLPPFSLLVGLDNPWLAGTPDFLCVKDENIWGLEIKTAGRSEGWGPSLNFEGDSSFSDIDDIPIQYYIQIQSYMAILPQIDRWDVCVLIGGRDLRVYRFVKNTDMVDVINMISNSFYEKYIADKTTLIPKDEIAQSSEASASVFPSMWRG